MEEKIEKWEREAWDLMRKADEETLKNLKDNEALFDNMVYYTIPKNELDEVVAIVSRDPDTLLTDVLFSEYDEDLIEEYIEKMGDKSPTGTFIIKFWGRDERASYEYDEWDFITSVNYEVEKLSFYNFEKALKQINRVKEVNKEILQKIIKLQYSIEKSDPMDNFTCLEEIKSIKKILCKEIDEVQ